jgi:hypothetical protein
VVGARFDAEEIAEFLECHARPPCRGSFVAKDWGAFTACCGKRNVSA